MEWGAGVHTSIQQFKPILGGLELELRQLVVGPGTHAVSGRIQGIDRSRQHDEVIIAQGDDGTVVGHILLAVFRGLDLKTVPTEIGVISAGTQQCA